MKKITVMALSLSLMLSLSACGAQKTDSVDNSKVIGKVGQVEITQGEYKKIYDMYLEMLVKQNRVDESVKAMLVDEALLKSELKANGIEVGQEKLDADYQKMIDGMGGKESYQKILDTNNISEDLYKKLSAIQTYRQAHVDWFKANQPVDDEALSNYYNEHKMSLDKLVASHILLDTKEDADKVKARLDAGEDFATVAKETSTGPTGVNGGKLGEIPIDSNNYDPTFLEALKKLAVGEVSAPVQTQFGFHIIKLDDKKEGLEAAKDEIINTLSEEKYMKYYEELKEKSEISFDGDKKEESKEAEKTDEKEAPKSGEEKTEDKAEDTDSKADEVEKTE